MENTIFIDTETGGTNPNKHSLFSVGLVAWNREEGIVDSCEIFIKSESYSYTKEAQKINKFQIEQHEKKALSHKEAIDAIYSFCKKNTGKTKEIQMAGHNIQFDIAFLRKLFDEENRSINRLISHRMIDTFSIIRFLIDAGKIEMNHISSANAFKAFNIMVEDRHSALGDAIATVKLYEELLNVVQFS